MVAVKICGIREPEALKASVEGGASFVGFMFYPNSPRYVSPDTVRNILSPLVPDGVSRVGVFVNPSDDEVVAAARSGCLDFIQLHGDETPGRVLEIKQLTGLPVIKAVRVNREEDLLVAQDYGQAADWFLFDAGSGGKNAYGGTGRCFDWGLLEGKKFSRPWMLAGGISAANAGQALEKLEPDALDLSSCLEDSPGNKSPDRIREFFDSLKERE